MPACWPWCGAAGAVAGLFDEASFELPTPMPRDAEMPHGGFLVLGDFGACQGLGPLPVDRHLLSLLPIANPLIQDSAVLMFGSSPPA